MENDVSYIQRAMFDSGITNQNLWIQIKGDILLSLLGDLPGLCPSASSIEAGCICRNKTLGKISATESEVYEHRVLCLLSIKVNKMAARNLRLPQSAV